MSRLLSIQLFTGTRKTMSKKCYLLIFYLNLYVLITI